MMMNLRLIVKDFLFLGFSTEYRFAACDVCGAVWLFIE